MARTIYFPDGSREVLFCGDDPDKSLAELERIVRERLGRDAAEFLRETVAPPDYDTMQRELRSYEGSLESYRACLLDIQDELQELAKLLLVGKKKATRAEIIKVLNAQIQKIHNET